MRVSGEGEAAKATVAKRGRTEPRDLFIRKWDLSQGGKRMEGEDYCGLLSVEDKEEKNTDEKCIATLGDGGNIAKSKKISRRPPGFSILPFPKSSLYLLNLVYNEVVIIFF